MAKKMNSVNKGWTNILAYMALMGSFHFDIRLETISSPWGSHNNFEIFGSDRNHLNFINKINCVFQVFYFSRYQWFEIELFILCTYIKKLPQFSPGLHALFSIISRWFQVARLISRNRSSNSTYPLAFWNPFLFRKGR